MLYRDRSNGYLYLYDGYQSYCSYIGFDGKTNMHVVLTMSAGDYARLYVNGILVITASYTLSSIPTPTYFYVGAGTNDVQAYLLGSVSEFRIWGGSLSSDEVLANFYAGKGSFG
jgi:hypothetical protein